MIERVLMPVYQTRLKTRADVAERTMAFQLEKPSGFQFKPGQYLDLTLIDPPQMDSQGAVRTLSIASAPYEDDLLVATRLRDSAFKRLIMTLPLGTELKFEGPMGSFTLHKNSAKAAVFLAGGIGITPFRSIVRQAIKEKFPHQLYLFYCNRRPEDAAFLDELPDLSQSTPHFIFVPSMTEMEKSKRKWSAECGFINREMLVKHFCDLNGPIYYVAGPPAMVVAMQQMLIKAGVCEDDIRTEEFGGY
ncbi:MAG TPA: FAD-dependent oxidoreductase [Candidatus Acidoferrales bacterium]|nr:FAD-dependent oxidoreductase [Candidatus Acidoferrales bacterium]